MQSFGRIGQEGRSITPTALALRLLYGAKVHAIHQQSGRTQRTQPLADFLIDQTVILGTGLPAHAANQAYDFETRLSAGLQVLIHAGQCAAGTRPSSIMKFHTMKIHLIAPSHSGQPALQIQLLGRAAYSSRDPVRMHSLGMALERQQGVHAIASDRRENFDTWPGTLAYTPPGVEVFSESATGGEYLVLRYAADAAEEIGPKQRISWQGHRAALQLAQHLRQQLLHPHIDALALEQSAQQFMALHHSADTRASAQAIQAAKADYARVLDRIAAEFNQPISIADLAQMVNTSPLRFLRAFTQFTGMTPHAWITETRLQAARTMMLRRDLSLTQIALDCGFSHQSHMGSVFRKHLGMTPGQYLQNHGQSKSYDC